MFFHTNEATGKARFLCVAQKVISGVPRRYKENEKLPEHVKEKLHCLSTILGLLANPSAHHLQPH